MAQNTLSSVHVSWHHKHKRTTDPEINYHNKNHTTWNNTCFGVAGLCRALDANTHDSHHKSTIQRYLTSILQIPAPPSGNRLVATGGSPGAPFRRLRGPPVARFARWRGGWPKQSDFLQGPPTGNRALVLVGCTCSGLVGGLPFEARVGVISWLLFRGFLACVGGLTFLACACAFDGFLL